MKKKLLGIVGCLAMLTLAACGHEHEFKEANCVEPKTCITCGETEGEALGHIFKEATCTTPRVCSICEVVEQEALGHTVEVGNCENCGEIINAELINEMIEITQRITDYNQEAVNYISRGDYAGCTGAIVYLKDVKKMYGEMYDLCGDYKELRTLKSRIKAVQTIVPTTVSSSSQEGVLDFIDRTIAYMESDKELSVEMAELVKD